jgi:PAS domain-containing protein
MLRANAERVIATGSIETGEEMLDTAHGRRTFLSPPGGPCAMPGSASSAPSASRATSPPASRRRMPCWQSAVRLRLLVEHSPVALAMFDMRNALPGRQRPLVEGLRSAGGQSLIGRSHYEVFPEIGEDLKELHRRGLAGEALGSDADRFERADGSVQWLRWQLRPWLLPEGEDRRHRHLRRGHLPTHGETGDRAGRERAPFP